MEESWVRGIFFYQVLNYVRTEKGQSAYELLGMDIGEIRADKKYDFEEFADLLAKVDMMIGDGDPGFICAMSRATMIGEASWKVLFRRMHPRNIFSTTTKQAGRHNLADFKTLGSDDNHVRLSMTMWTDNAAHRILWADFYKGRLEGILSLMGRKGTIRIERESNNGEFIYVIEWE